ncbi:MAG: ArsR family transcriptional regulator [Candidatus Electrothrix sp. AW2]|jgi:ArsR family transcriptional regulator|nr:ArsR family transcriptional regulator [Candidatus Electrothrix sp. AX1]MCI5119170.1 ArsR family transcriptional regulator [Candidatus Electrothrix gigas]MCI5129580.1 ArsR family transcriptional regulator [Candidatus Electrothrix gigas]MCI5135177.1 ArsR family transcriptional regulator [Candidatus Electrothrix gigas]MCI5181727.1 ArsR family transcriptional regulator [Candidatus Electrothrix gigas]
MEDQTNELAVLLKAISHPIRLKILCLLQDKELTVGEIREEVETSGANISQHLNIMRNQGIISSRKEANFIYNRIADERIIELMKTMKQLFCAIA